MPHVKMAVAVSVHFMWTSLLSHEDKAAAAGLQDCCRNHIVTCIEAGGLNASAAPGAAAAGAQLSLRQAAAAAATAAAFIRGSSCEERRLSVLQERAGGICPMGGRAPQMLGHAPCHC